MAKWIATATGLKVAPLSADFPGLEKLERSNGETVWDIAHDADQDVEVDIYTQDISFLITLGGIEAIDVNEAKSIVIDILSNAGFEKIKVGIEPLS